MKDVKERVISGGLARLVAQLAMFVLRFASLMILARLLTPEDFGLVTMVVAFAGFFSLFRDFGLSMAVVQRPTVTPELISTLFWLNALIGGVLMLLLLALSPFIAAFYQESRLQPVTAALAAGLLLNALGVQHRATLERELRFTTVALIDVTAVIISTAVGVAMAFQGYGYWSLVAMTIGVPVVSTLCAWKSAGWMPGKPRKEAGLRSMIQFGGITTLNAIVVYVAYNLEKILLGRFWGAETIGIYGRAYQLVNIPIENMNFAVGGVVFAALSRLQDDAGRLRSYFLRGYSLVLSLTVPIAIALFLFAEDIIRVVLGSQWVDAVPILRALAPTVLVFALINPLGWLVLSIGLVGRSLKIALVLAPLVISAYLIALPHGPVALAISYSAAMLVWVVPHILWCVHGTVITFKDVVHAAGKPLLSGTAAGLFASLILLFDVPGPPLARLLVSCVALFAVHFAIIMFVMGEKDVYLSLVRGLLKPGMAAH